MPANAFASELGKLMRDGNLRVADVARWFGRRHSTVRGWVVDGREPAGTAADTRALFRRLNGLRRLAERQRGLELRAQIKALT